MSGPDNRRPPGELTVWPFGLAVGVAVLLVGLVVDPTVITPLGGAIAAVFGFLWLRSLTRAPQTTPPSVPDPAPARQQLDRRWPGTERVSRDRFLKRATIGLGGIVAAAVALPAAGLAILPSLEAPRRRGVDLGPIAAFPQGAFVITTFLTDPAAGEVSRRSAYVRNNGLLGSVPSFTIMSSRCTHVGCPTQPLGLVLPARVHQPAGSPVGLAATEAVAGFSCPCHGSAFDDEGNRTAGPAPRALDRYQFSIRNGNLVLGQLYSVSHVDGAGAEARIHAYRLLQAGQPATGIESDLYPLQPGQ
jgi:quinol---cytochrome c reductase iron-sulfur subunit, bacillus type